MKLRITAALLLVWAASALNAQTLLRNDVVVAVHYLPVMCPTPAGVLLLSPDLSERSSIYDSGQVAVDAKGRIYVLSQFFITPELTVFDAQLQKIRSTDLVEPSTSFTVDDSGRAFVVGESGLVRVYSPDGQLVSTFTLPNVATPVRNMSIDIAPDRCTLIYTGPQGAAERYDVCSATSLPPVASGLEAVRALRDGGFVAATAGRIDYFDRDGRLVADQPAPTAEHVNALAFGADGRTL